MRTNEFGELTAFVAVAEEKSFRKAAARLNLTASTLSYSLRALEERLGVRLLNRTTRTVSPTQAGLALLAEIAPAFNVIANAVEKVNAFRESPQGRVRINTPRIAADMIFLPQLQKFCHQYPDVQLELATNDGFVDIISQGFDAGVRIRSDVQQDMSAVPVNGPVTVDNVSMMTRLALDGIGLVYTAQSPEHDDLVTTGRLIRVLADWSITYPGFFLYYPGHRQLPAALKAVIDCFRLPF
ncbi:LysR family transcriptional regulator [Aeromonas salmonicida]|uniref:LysR family transcriptional regulator n=1 Tax=Aeromonas salmonicida TaxID=645 RepID=UPI00224090F5